MDFSSLFDNYFFILHAVLGIVFGVVIYSFKIQSIRYYQMLIIIAFIILERCLGMVEDFLYTIFYTPWLYYANLFNNL